jgi:biopolymer transport protein ExbD
MRKKKKVLGETDIDLKPFMNVIVVLIPMLLMSAEFAKIAIIDIKLPEGRGSSTSIKQTVAPEEDKSNKLLLTAIITDSVVTLGAKGGFLPSLFYREFHKYVAKDDHEEFTVEYKAKEKVYHPKSHREMTIYERYDIFLYVTDENRNIIKTLYTKKTNLMLTDVGGLPVKEAKVGDTIFALTNPRMMMIVKDPSDYELQPESAYDELKNRLMKIKERYREAAPDDGSDIIIAAENAVIYDKIVQIMDASRAAEFPNISIAKLRM